MTNKNIKQLKIGIIGQIRSGKNTVAEMLKEELTGPTNEFAFSEGIHKVIKDTMPELYEQGKPRQALQEIGQLFRKFSPDVWINTLLGSERYTTADSLNNNIIVSDVRQVNEVVALKKAGFIIIKVVADDSTRIERAERSGDNFTPEMFNHETEVQARKAKANVIIDNSGTLKDLRHKVQTFVQAYAGQEVN